MTDDLDESNSGNLSIDQKEELSSCRPLCNRNNAVSENCKNEDIRSASNINNPRDTLFILNKLKIKNINRSVIGRLNIKIFKYSLSSKFGQLKLIIEKNIDILVIAEITIDSTNLSCQFKFEKFKIEGLSMSHRCNRKGLGGVVIVYVR